MDFVKDNQLVDMPLEVEFRFGELGAVLFGFQVEVSGAQLPAYRQRQGRLAHLSGTEQADRGNLLERLR